MTRQSITLPEHIAAPYFCEDKTDFQKLLFAEAKAQSHDTEETIMFIIGARILLHEYLSLVLSGKMEPYKLDDEFVKKEAKGFKDTIHLVNEEFAKYGVPLVEGEDGKMNIDYEALHKKIEEGDNE